MTELATIDLTQIDVEEGLNPRGPIDADQLQPLVDSIGMHGVLQPIIVAPYGDRYILVAGERRFRAAGIAGETEIPAVVRAVNGDALSVAIVENLQREQLSPVEEARAFARAIDGGMDAGQLAAAVGVSQELVRDRVALLELPEPVQERIASRELGVGAAKLLRVLEPAGPAVMAKAAELIVAPPTDFYDEPLTVHDLERNPAWVLDQTLDELVRSKTEIPFLAPTTRYPGILEEKLPWPKDVNVAALKAKAKELPERDGNYRDVRRAALELNDADVDAARAYGCVLELGSTRDDSQAWITDPVWLADRLNQKLDAAIAKQTKGKKQPKSDVTDAAKNEQDAKRKERQKEQAAMLTVRERNVRLGIALFKELHAPAPTVEGMRAIAELLVVYAGDDLGRSGWRFTDEASQTVTTRKDGTISRVTHVRGTTDCRRLLEEAIAKASTPEQIYGVLLQVLVASVYADPNAAPASDRFGEVRGITNYGANGTIAALVEKVAAVLPDDLRKKAKRRR